MENNKGFSLVEIIIVIAIMAILSAVLAPQLIKYIKNSKVSLDNNNKQSIKTIVNGIVAEEEVNDEIMNSNIKGIRYITFKVDGKKPDSYNGTVSGGEFEKEFEKGMNNTGEWPKVEQDNSKVFLVTVEIDNDEKRVANVTVDIVDR